MLFKRDILIFSAIFSRRTVQWIMHFSKKHVLSCRVSKIGSLTYYRTSVTARQIRPQFSFSSPTDQRNFLVNIFKESHV